MIVLANLIFPAFTAPYIAPLLFPIAGIAAIVAETVVFKLLNWHLGLGRILGLVVLANVASGAVGYLIALVLPSGLVGEPHDVYVILSFVPAWVLSILIEYRVVRAFAQWVTVPRPFSTVAWANTASYLTLFVVAVWARMFW
jgi:hypothetical protein